VLLYTRRRPRLAKEVGPDAMLDVVGSEGSHGAARLDAVINSQVREFNHLHIPSLFRVF
jgi:hypothetical protein